MRPVLSTRLFAAAPITGHELRRCRSAGFVQLELRAHPLHQDLLDPAETARLKGSLDAEGMTAPWLRLPPEVLATVNTTARSTALADAITTFGATFVSVQARAPGLEDLRELALSRGARLAVDVSSPARARALSEDVDVAWDLAAADEAPPEAARARLACVRIYHVGQDGLRAPPGEEESERLEALFASDPPGVIVYDVDDPSHVGSFAELERVLEALRAFHAGERRPGGRAGGGLFWAALAPG